MSCKIMEKLYALIFFLTSVTSRRLLSSIQKWMQKNKCFKKEDGRESESRMTFAKLLKKKQSPCVNW